MQQFTILLVLIAAAMPARAADDLYQKQSSWAESMTATRRHVMQLHLKDLKPGGWHQSDALPANSLADTLFPDDRVDLQTRDDQKRHVLRPQSHWKDGHVHGLGNRPQTVRYLYREIRSATAGAEEIKLACDSPIRVWCNGEQVFSGDGTRPFQPGQETVRLNLKAGLNGLLVKVYTKQGESRFWFEMPAANMDRLAVWEQLYRKFWDDFAETDWFLQDNPHRQPEKNDFDAQRDFGWYFEPGRDAQQEQQLLHRVLAELGAAGRDFAIRAEKLAQARVSADDPAWLTLYADACLARRQRRLEPLLAHAPRLVFTKHYTLGGSHYAYTEGQSDAQSERSFVPRAALCLLTWDGREIREETLLDDPQGVIRDPDVSYDGQRVLFAWKKSDREDDYHLYEMDLATRQIRQLTQGLGVADYEACYLPDGDIIFNSTRCVQTVDCWWTEVSNLYRCDRDGRFLRRLTFDQVHDNYPTVTPDGRILYTRWEYNDRGQVYPQPLLQMNPDGTTQCDFYGGNSWFPTTILHARGVPATQKVLAIASGHHSRQTGKLIVIDPAKGRQENTGVQLVAPVRDTPAVKVDAYGQEGELFQYPYPLSENEYLVTYHPVGWRWTAGGFGPRFGVYFMTSDGRRERLASDPQLPCSQPVPARPRAAAPPRPSQVDYRQTTGDCYVQDVYSGLGIAGVERGTIKTLRVVSLEFRAAGIGSNGNGGPGGGAMVSTPVAIGNGAWDPKVILGDVPVHEDGSAFFRVPARRPVYFQLLDAQGRLVQTMRSWATLQPGEHASCVGCHEDKNSTPVIDVPLTAALRRGPQDPRPFYGPPRGFSFPREVQPILDRQCIRCHTGEPGKEIDLTSRPVEDRRAQRIWTASYLALTHAHPDDAATKGGWRGNPDHPVLNWVSAQSAPPMLPPYSAGANRSKLIELLDKGHQEVRLSREELDKLAAWIDLGVPFCADYLEANNWSSQELDKYRRYASKRERFAAEDQANIGVWLRQQ